MPFTASHVAAVLPLLRSPLPASALVVGSLAPDLPFYLPGRLEWPTHTPLGLVTLDPLLGACAWLLWHGLLAAPALDSAPVGVRRRMTGRVEVGLRRRLSCVHSVLLVLAGLVVGSLTHLLWDELTHADRWGTRHVALLADDLWGLPGHRWAQYASGVLGIAAVAGWLVLWWRRAPERPVDGEGSRWWPWVLLAATGAVAGCAAALASGSPGRAAFLGATRGGAAVAVVAVGLALAWHRSQRRSGRPGSGSR